jgi:predicted dehydrogenase
MKRRMTQRLRWGILSTGKIAAVFARGVAGSRHGVVVAVGSRTAEAARQFAGEHGIEAAHAHGSYEALLADEAVDAVYIATPHPQHIEWALKAAAAGKAILCEKPVALNRADAAQMIAAARAHGVLFMEAFMYRCHPQTARVAALIREGAVGRVGLVQASFGFRVEFDATSRLWNRELGGGGILDVGGYPVSYARLIAGANAGQAFAEPTAVHGAGVLHAETHVDAYAAAQLTFAGGMIAHVSCGVGLTQENVVRIHGTGGTLLVTRPYAPGLKIEPTTITLHRAGVVQPEEITITPDRDLYAYEADAFAEAYAAGRREVAAMTPEDTLGNMAVLDAWRRDVGVVYAGETSGLLAGTV